MPEFKLVLDTSKPHAENRGDCLPDDPHYRVKYWQGQMVGKDMVLLPFDAAGELVPDDGKAGPWQALNSDGKPCTHFPLWNKAMRDLLERKKKRSERVLTTPETDDEEDETAEQLSDDVNFVLWLKGQAQYEWSLLQVAGKKRYSIMWTSKRQMVDDLVLDHKVVSEDEVCPALRKHISKKETEAA
jgi:hypothetical protein